ncbi:uncharacterized protein G2W53_039853 [Senna tora]|uniref:Secreted protein n=1 Tax=Senna tora TaxID=362788 RepID=A0A834SU09_9FABA|nr:uncharacterized protein G2W53_039853 [Senna tora]
MPSALIILALSVVPHMSTNLTFLPPPPNCQEAIIPSLPTQCIAIHPSKPSPYVSNRVVHHTKSARLEDI